MERVILCDIDGTIANIHVYEDGEPARGIFEYDKVGLDVPVWPIIDLVKLVINDKDVFPVFITGREDSCRAQTVEWLDKYFDGHYVLLMRKTGDRRKNEELKMEKYAKYVNGKYEVLYVFEDNDNASSFYRRCGLTCLQVADQLGKVPAWQ
jgi:hypothetical protein